MAAGTELHIRLLKGSLRSCDYKIIRKWDLTEELNIRCAV